MRQKQANCPRCGISLFQAQDELKSSDQFFMLYGAIFLSVISCGLLLPFTIPFYLYWYSKQQSERAIYRCSKCGEKEPATNS